MFLNRGRERISLRVKDIFGVVLVPEEKMYL